MKKKFLWELRGLDEGTKLAEAIVLEVKWAGPEPT